MIMSIQEWKNKIHSNAFTDKTELQTLQWSIQNSESTRKVLIKRTQTVNLARTWLENATYK